MLLFSVSAPFHDDVVGLVSLIRLGKSNKLVWPGKLINVGSKLARVQVSWSNF